MSLPTGLASMEQGTEVEISPRRGMEGGTPGMALILGGIPEKEDYERN